MRKLLMISALLLLLCGAALAEGTLSVETPAGHIRPGKAVTLTFTAPAEGLAEMLLKDSQGQTVSVVVENYAAVVGENRLWWNGTYQGAAAPQGEYQLLVSLNGETASAPVTVGTDAPYLTSMALSSQLATPAAPVTVNFYASCAGQLTVGLLQGGQHLEIATVQVSEGQQSYLWQTDLYTQLGIADGTAFLTLQLTDDEDFNSNEEHLSLTLSGFEPAATAQSSAEPAPAPSAEAAEEVVEEIIFDIDGNVVEETPEPSATQEPAGDKPFTPSYTSPYTDETRSYWTLPMDITDEEAVWEVLMQPITILYSSKDKAERLQVTLRAEPDEDSEGVGVVTCMNQGVHVLETLDNGWSLIEAYSSSFKSSAVKRWNLLVQGYVKTSYLKEVQPQTEYGIVVDKLTQRLYLFKEGKLFSTLLVSTGLVNETQPFNETRSGEYLLTSAVGDFMSGNMTCAMGLRFNSGDLMHEVPHLINADGTKNYGYTEPALGSKASHGCIRVQRRKTPEGINMDWLWDNRVRNTKLLIWEDWQGRQIDMPADDLTLYYNPNGGDYYHSSSFCYMAPKRTFEPFSYSQLEDEGFAKLKRCNYCTPALRVAEIEKINETYAEGGDHNALLTELQEKQLAKEAKE